MKDITIVRRPDGFIDIAIGDVTITMKKQYWEFLDKLIENLIWSRFDIKEDNGVVHFQAWFTRK